MTMSMLNEARSTLKGSVIPSAELMEEERQDALRGQRRIGIIWVFSSLVALFVIISARGGLSNLNLGPYEAYKPDSYKFKPLVEPVPEVDLPAEFLESKDEL